MKSIFDSKYHEYAQAEFIDRDPISIPHRFYEKQDIEIAGFFAAIFAWGRRDIIIRKASELMELMDNRPFHFIQNYSFSDFLKIKNFRHRTFNSSDLDFYLRAFQMHYRDHDSLESAFLGNQNDYNIESHIKYFYQYISNIVPHESRNLKHISTPAKNSACKRLCMYLRWMVREDEVDFGIWKSIKTSQLVLPLDLHVMNTAYQFNLLENNEKPNWKTAILLTEKMKQYDKIDPVKYDFALFGMSESGKYEI